MNRIGRTFLAMLCGLTVAAGLRAEEAQPLAPYQTPANLTSTLRVWGDRHMEALVRAWAAVYKTKHPEITVDVHLLGNGTAMPALYLGLADLVLMGRDPIVTDNDGFAHVKKYSPLKVEFGTGSVDVPGRAPALVLLVNQANPLRHLSLTQVDAIFSSLRLRGGPAAILTWGQLGLTGDWADRPINLYGPDTQSPSGYFFERVALGDSHRMNWDHYHEFQDVMHPDGTLVDGAAQAAAAVATDRYGLAISTLAGRPPATAVLGLAADGEAVAPTMGEVASRRYPLARPLIAFADKPPSHPLDPKVKDFLTFVLGPDGQAVIGASGSYLPLSAKEAARQLQRVP